MKFLKSQKYKYVYTQLDIYILKEIFCHTRNWLKYSLYTHRNIEGYSVNNNG